MHHCPIASEQGGFSPQLGAHISWQSVLSELHNVHELGTLLIYVFCLDPSIRIFGQLSTLPFHLAQYGASSPYTILDLAVDMALQAPNFLLRSSRLITLCGRDTNVTEWDP